MRRYKFDIETEHMQCWVCGENCDEATLIEWKKGFEKEILCHSCLGQLYHNDKNIKILGRIFE